MKLAVEIKLHQDWNETPVHVEISEEIAGGDFDSKEAAKVLEDAVVKLTSEAVMKAERQINTRMNLSVQRQLADEREREAALRG